MQNTDTFIAAIHLVLLNMAISVPSRIQIDIWEKMFPKLEVWMSSSFDTTPNTAPKINRRIGSIIDFVLLIFSFPCYFQSKSSQAASSSLVTLALKTFPSSKVEFGQLGFNFSLVLPIPLPPDVANGIIVLPLKS